MYQQIKELSEKYYTETINIRRNIHKYAERGWLETRTACMIATKLDELGYEVLTGKDIMNKDDRMGLPHERVLQLNDCRAFKEGVNEKYFDKVKSGMTAVAGIYKNGQGPTIA